MHARRGSVFRVFLGGSFIGLVMALFLSTLPRGLWEDGYFVKRFAHQFWRHGMFAWNPSDGPIYGMTSQTLQFVGTVLYAIDPRYLVTLLRATLCIALIASVFTLERSARRQNASPLALVPIVVALSLPLVLELVTSGLETALAICVVALALHAVLEFDASRARPWAPALAGLAVYWTRPDAVLIPILVLAALSGGELWRAMRDSSLHAAGSCDGLRRRLRAFGLLALGLGLSLALFRAYYGTALPLPFYIKTHGLSVQTPAHLAIFEREKIKNATQALFFALPFVAVALHERTRVTFALLGASLCLALYHYVVTVETMGHLSRFYVPALVPIWLAAARAYPAFISTRRTGLVWSGIALYGMAFVCLARVDARYHVDIWLDPALFYPQLVASGVMLAWPSARPWFGAVLIGASLWAAAAGAYPPRLRKLAIEDDTTILLRQIAPRRTFRGLARLAERVPVHALFHTDMGAPGLLFPEARVVDLDGLLNEAITLHGARFETLCQADRPEAIFVPNESYPELRREVLESACLRDYRTVDADPSSPLRIRADLRESYLRDRN